MKRSPCGQLAPLLALVRVLIVCLGMAVLPELLIAQAPQQGSVTLGDARLKEHHYSEAMEQYESALRAEPGNRGARQGEVAAANAWAAEEARQQRGDQAMAILERAIALLPNESSLLVSFGLEAMALGQFPIATQALAAADRMQPHDPTTIYAMARLEIAEQHLPDAERSLTAYLRLRPDDASAYYGLGYTYQMEQRVDDARRALQQSIALQPTQTESYFQLGELELQAQHDAEAETLYEKVIARAPHHAGALTGMGQIALRARQYARAEQLLGEAEHGDPAYAKPHYFRGLALARLGRTEEAEQELRRVDSRPHAAPSGAGQDPSIQDAGTAPKPPGD